MKATADQDVLAKLARLHAVMEAGRRIHAAVDAADAAICERLGVNRSDLRCLNLLGDGPLTPGEIGDRIGLASGSVTALIDRLERAGFVERRPSARDRRCVEIATVDEPYGRVAALYRTLGRSVMQAFSGGGADEIAAAARALETFAAGLERGLSDLRARPEGRP